MDGLFDFISISMSLERPLLMMLGLLHIYQM